MTTPASFYRLQAEACARSAAATNLPNQRDTFLRAAAAWQDMADRSQRTVDARLVREEESRARVAAEVDLTSPHN
jgi:hypothetical protein